MRKGLKLSSVIGILLLTIGTLSFRNSTLTNAAADLSTKSSHSPVESEEGKSVQEVFNEHALSVYNVAGLAASGLDYEVFLKGFMGYHNLRELNRLESTKAVLSVVDLNLPSTAKRLWVIDLNAQKLLFNTLVAHGRGSGEKKAEKFSNIPSSNQSSVGFYTTAEVYRGKHGRSLRLDGLDAELNSKARERAIVVHGAEYVSQEVIDATGRLGRSQGCPALPMDIFSDIIDDIKGHTLLFINGDGVDRSEYLQTIERPLAESRVAAQGTSSSNRS